MGTFHWPQWLSNDKIIVLLSGFLCQMIMEGIIQAQDVFPPHIHDYFKCSYAEASVSHSLMHGFSEIIGPLSSALTKRLGERFTVLLGTAVVTAGFLGCSLSYRLINLNITSAIAGFGFGIMSVPIVTVVSFHFEKRRRYVMTTATTIGGALGAALFPFILDALIDAFPWQYAFSFIACITAQLAVLGLLLSRKKESIVAILEKESAEPSTLREEVLERRISIAEMSETVPSAPCLSKIVVPLFLISSLFWHIGSYVFEVLPLRLDQENFSGDQIALAISMQALFVIVGRLLATAMMGKFHLDPVLLYNTGTLFIALTRTIISWQHGYNVYLLLISISGFGMGIATALVPSVVLRLAGIERLNFIYGLELLMRGLSGIMIPIAGAYLADTLRGNFFYTFLIGGLSLITATICLLPYHWPLSIVFGMHYTKADVKMLYA